MSKIQIELANPRGFCAGVDRAISIVEQALDILGAPIYVRHEVVHNRHVVEGLRERGAIFVEELDDIPDDATVIFSAHGVSKAVRTEADKRGLKVFDATCPLVTKVHMEVARLSRRGWEAILIGHAGHPEVEGTMGQFDDKGGGAMYLVQDIEEAEGLEVKDPQRLAYVTQTTLSMDDTAAIIAILRRRFPAIQGPKTDDICYATQNRQDAIRELAQRCDLVFVVGSTNSSNSNRLRELAAKAGTNAYLVDGPESLDPRWLSGVKRIGVTAGASAPEILVQGLVERLCALGAEPAEERPGREENIVFALPRELREAMKTPSSALSHK